MLDAKMFLLKTTELYFIIKWLEKNKLTHTKISKYEDMILLHKV
jgi:hypothetical protein